MGKKKIEKISLISNLNTRKVTFCKRKKGLLKKSMELSMLCDLSIFIFIKDKTSDRCVHYCSEPDKNLLSFFNSESHREFYNNKDYLKMGGRAEDLPDEVLATFDHHDRNVGNTA